jgi:hypothetical protein
MPTTKPIEGYGGKMGAKPFGANCVYTDEAVKAKVALK